MSPEGAAKAKKGDFLSDMTEIRRRARQQIMDGAVTPEYRGDRKTVVQILNQAFATELVCVLRYKRHHFAGDVQFSGLEDSLHLVVRADVAPLIGHSPRINI